MNPLTRLNPHAVRAILCLASALLMLLAIGAAGWWLARHRAAAAIEATVQHRAVRVAADTRAQVPADSATNTLRGRGLEARARLAGSQRLVDSLRRAWPAAGLVLPAIPPRYQP